MVNTYINHITRQHSLTVHNDAQRCNAPAPIDSTRVASFQVTRRAPPPTPVFCFLPGEANPRIRFERGADPRSFPTMKTVCID